MPARLRRELARAAATKGLRGERADSYVYGTLNNLGLMHGNKETAKGKAFDRGANLGTFLHPKRKGR